MGGGSDGPCAPKKPIESSAERYPSNPLHTSSLVELITIGSSAHAPTPELPTLIGRTDVRTDPLSSKSNGDRVDAIVAKMVSSDLIKSCRRATDRKTGGKEYSDASELGGEGKVRHLTGGLRFGVSVSDEEGLSMGAGHFVSRLD